MYEYLFIWPILFFPQNLFMLSLLSLSIVVFHKFWAYLVCYSFKCCSSPFSLPFGLHFDGYWSFSFMLSFSLLLPLLKYSSVFLSVWVLFCFELKPQYAYNGQDTRGKKTSRSLERGRTCWKYVYFKF